MINMKKKLLEKDFYDIDGDEGWILVTRETKQVKHTTRIIWQPIRGKMLMKLERQKLIQRPKREKVEVHNYKKTQTLCNSRPSSFDKESTKDNVEASGLNVDKARKNKVHPTDKEERTSESSIEVSPNDDDKATKEISSMMSASHSKNPVGPSF